jgi:chromosome segregation ATPase
MPRTNAALAAVALLASAAFFTPHAFSGSYSYGFDNDRDRLGWAIVSGDNTSMSDMQDLGSMDDLKSEFGREFLYIRQGGDRYVIRDRALMQRAKDAARPMQEAGREIGEAARAQAEQALSGSRDARERARLARRIAKLSEKIARRESEGESTEDLERSLEALQQEVDGLPYASREERGAIPGQRAREARTRDASERLKKAARHLNQEMRDILREAKSRHVAEPVD